MSRQTHHFLHSAPLKAVFDLTSSFLSLTPPTHSPTHPSHESPNLSLTVPEQKGNFSFPSSLPRDEAKPQRGRDVPWLPRARQDNSPGPCNLFLPRWPCRWLRTMFSPSLVLSLLLSSQPCLGLLSGNHRSLPADCPVFLLAHSPSALCFRCDYLRDQKARPPYW